MHQPNENNLDQIPASSKEAVSDVNVSATSSNKVTQFTRVGNKDFERLKILGDGCFGSVILVRKKGGSDHGRLYAMKIISKLSRNPRNIENAVAERQILEAVLNVPSLVQMHYAFETETYLYLILDYLNGADLLNHIRKFKTEEVRLLVAEIVLAVERLHKLGIVHRDLKLDNLMLDQNGHIVLIDFGSSIQFLKDEIQKTITHRMVGTVHLNAPEVVNHQEHGMAADWWSVGIITYALMKMDFPFESDTQSELIRLITYSQPNFEGLSKSAVSFIKQLLEKDQQTRLGSNGDASEVKGHEFFKGIDWNHLADEKYKPPILPKIQNELDTSNFSPELVNNIDIDTDSSELTCDSDGEIFNYYFSSATTTEKLLQKIKKDILVKLL